jgi:hypothetical protein
MMKYIYAVLSVVGAAAPLSQFIPWLADNGLSLTTLVEEAFSSRISAFAWLDVFVSALVVAAFILVEGKRLRVRHLWAPLIGLASVGVSFGLPLFLFLRELQLQKTAR